MKNKTFYGPIVLESGFSGTNTFAKAFFNACETFDVDWKASDETLVFSSTKANGSKMFFETDKIVTFEARDNGYTKVVTVSGDTYHLWDAARKEVETELNAAVARYLQRSPAPAHDPFEYKFEHTVNNRIYDIHIFRLTKDRDIYIHVYYFSKNSVFYSF